jgi:large subunit ribosomal protein L29
MALIVNLREESSEKIEERLEDAREAMFKLRFRHASSRLDDVSEIRRIRREIAQFETVLRMRDLAVNTALQQPEIAAALKGREWSGEAEFDYRDSGWMLNFWTRTIKKLLPLW